MPTIKKLKIKNKDTGKVTKIKKTTPIKLKPNKCPKKKKIRTKPLKLT